MTHPALYGTAFVTELRCPAPELSALHEAHEWYLLHLIQLCPRLDRHLVEAEWSLLIRVGAAIDEQLRRWRREIPENLLTVSQCPIFSQDKKNATSGF